MAPSGADLSIDLTVEVGLTKSFVLSWTVELVS